MNKLWEEVVKKNNRAFQKMTRPQKRVAIARDVLNYISKEMLQPKGGTYVSLYEDQLLQN